MIYLYYNWSVLSLKLQNSTEIDKILKHVRFYYIDLFIA